MYNCTYLEKKISTKTSDRSFSQFLSKDKSINYPCKMIKAVFPVGNQFKENLLKVFNDEGFY